MHGLASERILNHESEEESPLAPQRLRQTILKGKRSDHTLTTLPLSQVRATQSWTLGPSKGKREHRTTSSLPRLLIALWEHLLWSCPMGITEDSARFNYWGSDCDGDGGSGLQQPALFLQTESYSHRRRSNPNQRLGLFVEPNQECGLTRELGGV